MRIVLFLLAATLLFSGGVLLMAEDDDSKKKEEGNNEVIKLPGSMGLKISGELRFREEYWKNRYPMATEDLDFTRMRTRLRFDLDIRENLGAIVEFQDVRIMGSEGNVAADTEGVDIKRSEILVRNLFGKPLDLEFGRHVLAYGDQRLIGHLEWFDQGRTYDGFRLSYKPGDWYADFIGVRGNDTAVGDMNDQDLFGVYGGMNDLFPGGGLEAYLLLFRDQTRMPFVPLNMTERRFLTMGFRAFGKQDGLDASLEIAQQVGEDGVCHLNATAFAAVAGFTLEDVKCKPRIGVEVDFASGDRNPNDTDSETFQTLFPTNHLHYGYADLMGWSNMWDFKAGVKAHPWKNITVGLDWHHLLLDSTDDAWYNAGGGVMRAGVGHESRHLGEEIDLTVGWKPNENFSLATGFCHFMPGGFVDDSSRAPLMMGSNGDLDFVFVQARVVF